MAKAHAQYQALLNDRSAAAIPTNLKDEDDTHIDENEVRQPNPPWVNMLKIINHIGANSGPQGKHLKFPITTHLKGPYKHHLVVRVDTGKDTVSFYGHCWSKHGISPDPKKI